MNRLSMAGMLSLVLIVQAVSAGHAAEQKLLIAVVDRVTWHDLLAPDVDAPTIRRLAEEGAPGMMCVRAGRGFGGEYATIGAGSRAASRVDPATRVSVEADAFDVNESAAGGSARDVFELRTSWRVGSNAIVHLGIGDLVNANAEASYPVQIGLLGGTLRRAGIRVACVGNGDSSLGLHREAVTIAMDERGLVPLGDVADGICDRLTALPRSMPPYSVLTDTGRLASSVRTLAKRGADVIVVDAGDTSRVDELSASMTREALAAARRAAIENADHLLALLAGALPESRWAVLVITPSLRAPAHEETFAGLAPVIWRPAGSRPGGQLLTSPSTRRPGVVVNTDIAPTVLGYFGIPAPPEMVGRPFALSSAGARSLDRLESDVSRQDSVDAARPQLSRGLAIAAAIILWLTALVMVIGEGARRGVRMVARGLLVIVLSAPAAMLVVALRPMPPSSMIAVVIGLAALIAFVGGSLTRWRSGYVLPLVLVTALLVYDLFRGQQMLLWSPLSYSPAAGARFYGIGNEYGGALLGAAIMGGGALLRSERAPAVARAAIGAFVLALAALTALPQFGANLGMAFSIGVGGAILCLYLWRRAVRWPEATGAIVFAVGLVGCALGADYVLHGAETSHIGRFVASVRQEGWQAAWAVITRKLSMNLLLVRTSVWSDTAAAALGVLGVATTARPARMLVAVSERAWFTPSVISGFGGAIAAFLLNDSGIVAAAVVLIYVAGCLGYVSLGDSRG